MNKLAIGLLTALAAYPLTHATAQDAAAPADQLESLTLEARGKVKGFAMQLKKTLKAEIQSSGPQSAVAVCNEQAPAIAEHNSTDGWTIARTALKVRNQANQPDSWENKVMDNFASQLAAGADPKTLEVAEIQNGEFRYMKAIPVGEVCLACHGANIEPQLQAHISSLYPDDKAVGFELGQLRGAFTLTKPVN